MEINKNEKTNTPTSEASRNARVTVEQSTNKTNACLEKVEKLVEFAYMKFSQWVSIIGPCFLFSMIIFFSVNILSFFQNTLPYWNKKLPRIITMPFSLAFINEFVLALLNYLLCSIIKPGSIADIRKSKKFKQRSPYYFNLPTNIKLNFSHLLSPDNFDPEAHSGLMFQFPLCKYCKEIKPLRTHHCAVCGSCVIRMDHHCPWVNNCIGQHNHRYFSLFLFHLFCLCVLNSMAASPIFFAPNVNRLPSQFKFVTVLCLSGIMILIFFNLWFWCLLLRGDTSIEFWNRKMVLRPVIKSYGLKTIRENFYLAFGTENVLSALFIPSIKTSDISGLEWTRLFSNKFSIDGIEIESDRNERSREEEKNGDDEDQLHIGIANSEEMKLNV